MTDYYYYPTFPPMSFIGERLIPAAVRTAFVATALVGTLHFPGIGIRSAHASEQGETNPSVTLAETRTILRNLYPECVIENPNEELFFLAAGFGTEIPFKPLDPLERKIVENTQSRRTQELSRYANHITNATEVPRIRAKMLSNMYGNLSRVEAEIAPRYSPGVSAVLMYLAECDGTRSLTVTEQYESQIP